MKIAIGCDHGGFELKESLLKYLNNKNYEVSDFGCYSSDSVDYPLIGASVAKSVANNENEKAILICSTGIGISIAANKVKGVRAALCSDLYSAEMTRRHNNSNIICLGAQVTSDFLAKKLVDIFLTTEFEGDRHQRRIDLISKIEKDNK